MSALTRSFAIALALLTAGAGCGSDDDAVDTVATDTDVVVAVPDADSAADPTDLAATDPELEEPTLDDPPPPPPVDVEGGAGVTPDSPDPVPAAGPPEEGDQPVSAVPDDMLGILNSTGRTLLALHIVGCGESEGNDWDTMETWTTDYLDGEAVAAGGGTMFELVPGCYQVKSVLEGGASMQEEIQTTPGMVYEIEIDV